MRAIDLYSGIGGWSLGLKMAGIGVVRSYEWWHEAALTHEENFGNPVEQIDIRGLSLDSLPGDLDFVVGSPPCTQFSFSNRGGNGDIADGLKDVRKFLEVVEAAEPKYWAMENVPRVATILESELGPGGSLQRFRHLVDVITVMDMAEYGLPQRRRRMIAGRFPLSLFEEYKGRTTPRTLGDVVKGLKGERVVDPLYGFSLPANQLTENEQESPLNPEELRMNREAKGFHPVYNVMPFPDPLERTARTVTALCTRVSRESIVVKERSKHRRLTVRERACLQGFPVTFQFYGRGHSSKIKMIGNAIPPLATYFLACSMMEIPAGSMVLPETLDYRHRIPSNASIPTPPEKPRRKYTQSRKFRAAIPGLRFGSGMRIQLENDFEDDEQVKWRTDFFFGSSKQIRRVSLGEPLLDRIAESSLHKHLLAPGFQEISDEVRNWATKTTAEDLQLVWAQVSRGIHPFEIVDALGVFSKRISDLIQANVPPDLLTEVLQSVLEMRDVSDAAQAKLIRNQSQIIAGLIVGSWFSRAFPQGALQIPWK